MGLQLTVNKLDNALYHEFTDAYWKIESIVFSNANGVGYVSFELNTYPSRESSIHESESIGNGTGTIPVGGACAIAYSTRIRTWQATFKTADVFSNGIPLTESEQKQTLYALVKSYTGLNFTDVLED